MDVRNERACPVSGERLSNKFDESGQKTIEVSTDELRKIIAEKNATVFDARPMMEYAMSHIPGAVNVSEKPGVPISQYVSDVAEVGRIVGSNKSVPIVL